MKKLIALILILAMLLPAAALADLPDISGLSFDELIELKQKINLALWDSEEWQEVKVPIGVWKIGEDIPAGKWTISAATDNGSYLIFCDELDPSGMEGSFSGRFHYYTEIEKEGFGDESSPTSVDLDCYKGNYIIIKYGPVWFKPFTGKPDLGFH